MALRKRLKDLQEKKSKYLEGWARVFVNIHLPLEGSYCMSSCIILAIYCQGQYVRVHIHVGWQTYDQQFALNCRRLLPGVLARGELI